MASNYNMARNDIITDFNESHLSKKSNSINTFILEGSLCR